MTFFNSAKIIFHLLQLLFMAPHSFPT